MALQVVRRHCWHHTVLPFVSALLVFCGSALSATDYFLTIGGGYNPTGNQASLEANVVFFQQILEEKHRGARHHDIYFADGNDETADLQVVAEKPSKPVRPATELLAALHRRRDTEQKLEYRNHHVPNIAGATDPALIHAGIESIAKNAQSGDRLIVYVTAHGGEGAKGAHYNTTIACWNGKKITAREFSKWLRELPASVPVVMVMAQCYCGGFAHTIFNDLDTTKGLAEQNRAGFFAQQHNLPAAGCRPDISNDEEFSSYFWGAIAGRSRTGVPIEGCDIDNNGRISFAEAYAHAVTASPTIDIPLRTSEVFLRTYSRMTLNEVPQATPPAEATPVASESAPDTEKDADAETKPESKPDSPSADAKDPPRSGLSSVAGTLQNLADQGRPASGRIVADLSKELGFALKDDVASVVTAYDEYRRTGRTPSRGNRGRAGSGRRDLLKEVAEKWPELGDEKKWQESPLLKEENQEQLLQEMKQLPSWKVFEERRKQRQESDAQAARHELRDVKFRRLINTLETIVLEQNLSAVAAPEIRDRYRQMITLEESTLGSTESK